MCRRTGRWESLGWCVCCDQLALSLPWHCGQEPDFSVCPPFPTGIENLPFELQRNFQLMRDLDQRTEGEG